MSIRNSHSENDLIYQFIELPSVLQKEMIVMFFLVGVGYNGMPHGCNDDELPWGKSSKADPLDTKVNFFKLS